jgi:ribosomal protein S18 acetylase RimI-like enzyme
VDAFVEEATEATPELVEAFARLAPQLSSSSPPPSAEQLAEVVASPATVLLVARLGGEGEQEGQGGGIVGTTTLVLFRIPTGMRAWIEDVVVDESVRGGGVGEALTLAALERAADAGAPTVDLTSRPSREAANRLYARLGFALRETNVYRWTHPTT